MTSSPPQLPPPPTLLDEHDTEQTACTTEFCPWEGWEAWIATGTYQLVKQEGVPDTRIGRVLLHRLEKSKKKFILVQTLDVGAGVLDCKWQPAPSSSSSSSLPPTLACALSTGDIVTYHLQKTHDDAADHQAQLVPTTTTRDDVSSSSSSSSSSSFMSLALDWDRSPSTSFSSSSQIVSSQNKGRVAIHHYNPDTGALVPIAEWEAHALYGTPIEVWTATFAAGTGHVEYSGGDDSTLKGWDVRVGTSAPVWSDSKTHQAGVTAVQSSPWAGEEHVFVSGSYDGVVRLWDARKTVRPVCVQECDVEGGVWRLKWHPTDKTMLAVAAMHGGAWVVRLNEDEGMSKMCHHAKHESMVYGMDWWYGGGGGGEEGEEEDDILATCSFYDHALHLWQPPL